MNDDIMQINLMPFYCEALSIIEFIWKDIDRIYEEKKNLYYTLARNSEFYNCKMARERTLLKEEYFKKAIGILLYAETEQEEITVSKAVFKLMQKAYKKTYAYLCDKKQVDCEQYLREVIPHIISGSDEVLNGNATALLFFSLNLDIELMNKQVITDIFALRYQQNFDPKSYISKHSYDLNKIKKMYKNQFIQYKRKIPKNAHNLDFLLKDVHPVHYLYEAFELSVSSISEPLNSRDFEHIIASYIAYGTYSNSSPIDFDEYIITGIYIVGLLKAYRKVKEHYFTHNRETMFIELENLKEEIDLLRRQKKQADEKIKLLEKELSMLKKGKPLADLDATNERYEKLNSSYEEQRKELQALREFVYRESQPEDYNSENLDMTLALDKLNTVKGVIIGGRQIWQNKMKQLLKSWTFVSADASSFDKAIIENAHAIFIFTSYMNHGQYYKILSAVNERGKLHYLNTTNVDRVISQIADALNN